MKILGRSLAPINNGAGFARFAREIMMRSTKSAHYGLAAAILYSMLNTTAVFAKPAYQATFVSKYQSMSETVTERSCANCHMSSTDFKLNLYGKQIAQVMIEAGEKKLTPEMLAKVETLDANDNGVSNLEEIKAGKA